MNAGPELSLECGEMRQRNAAYLLDKVLNKRYSCFRHGKLRNNIYKVQEFVVEQLLEVLEMPRVPIRDAYDPHNVLNISEVSPKRWVTAEGFLQVSLEKKLGEDVLWLDFLSREDAEDYNAYDGEVP